MNKDLNTSLIKRNPNKVNSLRFSAMPKVEPIFEDDFFELFKTIENL